MKMYIFYTAILWLLKIRVHFLISVKKHGWGKVVDSEPVISGFSAQDQEPALITLGYQLPLLESPFLTIFCEKPYQHDL